MSNDARITTPSEPTAGDILAGIHGKFVNPLRKEGFKVLLDSATALSEQRWPRPDRVTR